MISGLVRTTTWFFQFPHPMPLATSNAQGPPQILSDPGHIFLFLLQQPVSSHRSSYLALQQEVWPSKCSSVLSQCWVHVTPLHTKQTLSPEMDTLDKTAIHAFFNKIKWPSHYRLVLPLHKFLFQLCFS